MDLSKGLFSLKFGAVWCGPCKLLEPKLNQIKEEFPQVTYISVDVDEEPEMVNKYTVTSVPVVILLRDGEEVTRLVGAQLINPLRAAFRELTENK